MKVLVLLELAQRRDPAGLGPLAMPENRIVWELYAVGTVREMHMRRDAVGAVFALEVADVDEARRVVDAWPMVEAGMLSAQVVPLAPFKPLETLFAK